MAEIRLDADDEPDGEAPAGSATGDRPSGRRRSRWLVAHLVAVVVLAGSVAYFVEVVTGDPEDVVGDYLAAVKAGDPDTALAIAGAEPGHDAPRDVFLTAKALRSDWNVDEVTTRRRSDTSAIVDTVVTGPDGRREGVFRLERRGSAGWRIDNPFVPLYLSRPPVWTDGDVDRNRLTVNGKTATVPEIEDGLADDGGIQLRLFPGTYSFFDTGETLVEPVERARTWLPPGDSSALVPYTPRLRLTDEGAELAQTAIEDMLAACARSTRAQPEGCPFGTDTVFTDDGTEYRIAADSISWKFEHLPELYFADTGEGRFTPVGHLPDSVQLHHTMNGRERFDYCDVDLEQLSFGVSTDGDVVFAERTGTVSTCFG